MSAMAAPALANARQTAPTSGAMVPQPTPDADALAAEMRVLADDPKNLTALLSAGELTLKLGDPTAASVLFARAEKVDPHNARLKADEAAGLVHMERPGEALRLFAEAEKLGADPASFAAERGLAYDLIGQQERAQRDYRLALSKNPDDAETIRRYALSLGISDKRDQALAVIDPLVRRSDHAGWRDRAFILAMTGQPGEAETIAKAMLPDDMAAGLKPFFEDLPGLSDTDKAFAVHFGEVAPTPQRLADARLVPPLPPLGPDTMLADQLAEAKPAPVPDQTKSKRRRHDRHARETATTPVAVAVKTVPSSAAPDTTPPQPGFTTATPPVRVAASDVEPSPAPRSASPTTQRPVSRPAEAASPPLTTASVVPSRATTTAAAPAGSSGKVGSEDRILADIIAGIKVPPAERAETPPPATRALPATTSAQPAPATAAPPDAAAEAKRLEAANVAAIKKAAEAKAAAQAAAEAKRKADEAKKAAAAKKAADDKAAAEKRAKEKEEKANPSRIWVQVAGGANEHDLPKAWANVKAKAPDAFKGKSGWSTPLNATNRVLAGPFKSDDAAQDFVNTLKKKGISAFPFTSDKGQKIDKLPAR